MIDPSSGIYERGWTSQNSLIFGRRVADYDLDNRFRSLLCRNGSPQIEQFMTKTNLNYLSTSINETNQVLNNHGVERNNEGGRGKRGKRTNNPGLEPSDMDIFFHDLTRLLAGCMSRSCNATRLTFDLPTVVPSEKDGADGN